jgi:hypothetical protein
LLKVPKFFEAAGLFRYLPSRYWKGISRLRA